MISEGARIVLSVLDEAKAELERDHPGWRIWFVPRTNGPTRWCAHRLPLLAECSPDDLGAAMSDVDQGRAAMAQPGRSRWPSSPRGRRLAPDHLATTLPRP